MNEWKSRDNNNNNNIYQMQNTTNNTRLFDAAIEGDVQSLLNLLNEDPLILDRYTVGAASSGHVMQSPLIVAVNLGHLDFTKTLLTRKPKLAAEQFDHLKRWTALHVAAAEGHLEIVQALLAVSPNMCFARDLDGRNPVHVAAINGHVHVLDQLFQAKPLAALERTNNNNNNNNNGGETVLHLCVKHNQQTALENLVNLTNDGELLNSKDADGNTVLHLAVTAKQLEAVDFLLKKKKMKRNAMNTKGSTAMDVFVKSRKHSNDGDIRRSLEKANELRAKDTVLKHRRRLDKLQNHRNALMVVASLIATMAFQVGTQPPGGTWQDNNDGHIAGLSIMADLDKEKYNRMVIYSNIGLISSLTVILLLISGLPGNRLFVSILMITMWIAVSATAVNFQVSVLFLSTQHMSKAIMLPIDISLFGWLFLMFLLLLTHTVRFIVKCLKKCCNWGRNFTKDVLQVL